MIESIKNEIKFQKDFINPNETIETIYFGGGTPSLLNAEELNSILEVIHQKFNVSVNIELTIEANPDDISYATVKNWTSIGVNRLSLGIQSFNDEELQWMQRAHNAERALNCIDEIFEAGISNFSVDLIFGSHYTNSEQLIKSLETIVAKNIPHLSCYALTAEPKTLLNHWIENKITKGLDTEKQAEEFLLIQDFLTTQGYEQYEISNYSKKGMRSKHNSSYWQGKPYYGFGPSAHSFDGKKIRRWNVANNTLYIKNLNQAIDYFEEEILTEAQQLNEYIMTSLRTAEGINLEDLGLKFGDEQKKILIENLQKHLKYNHLLFNNTHIILSREGKLFADGIAADLFF